MHCACFYHWKGQLDFFFFFAVVVMATIGISRVGGPLLTPLKVWIWAPCEHPFLNWKVLWAIGWSGEWCDSSSPLLLGLSAAQKHPSILRTVFISFFFFQIQCSLGRAYVNLYGAEILSQWKRDGWMNLRDVTLTYKYSGGQPGAFISQAAALGFRSVNV